MSSTPKAIGERLKRIREALNLNRREISKIIRVSEGNWSDFEKGKRRISLNAALRLYAETGIDPNFIYLGLIDRVPHKLALKLQAA